MILCYVAPIFTNKLSYIYIHILSIVSHGTLPQESLYISAPKILCTGDLLLLVVTSFVSSRIQLSLLLASLKRRREIVR
jgi:hypothetical protein